MSAQEFKPGDRIRVVNASDSDGHLTLGDEHVVKHVLGGGDVSWEDGWWWMASRFEKVEPEFVVGQQVSGSDYERLPVGSKAVWRHCADSEGLPAEKIAVGSWREGSAPNSPIRTDAEMSLPRTLTHLGDGTHSVTEPSVDNSEDTTDAYVEPEPLKAGDAVLVWAKVANGGIQDSDDMFRVWINPDGARFALVVQVEPDAIVRPAAGQVPPWVKPARCTSLSNGHGSDILHRCDQDEGHSGNHTAHYGAGRSWADAEAYGRVEVSS